MTGLRKLITAYKLKCPTCVWNIEPETCQNCRECIDGTESDILAMVMTVDEFAHTIYMATHLVDNFNKLTKCECEVDDYIEGGNCDFCDTFRDFGIAKHVYKATMEKMKK